MIRKILVFVVLAFSSVVFLPAESRAETNAKVSEYGGGNAFYQRGRRRGRGNRVIIVRKNNNRSWNRNKNRTRGFRLVRQYFWLNGRRHARMVRVYY